MDKAVKEAEQYAAEDKKRREDIEARNSADQMVYQCEKTMEELGDKIDAADKSDLTAKLGRAEGSAEGGEYRRYQGETGRTDQEVLRGFPKRSTRRPPRRRVLRRTAAPLPARTLRRTGITTAK